MQNPLKRFAIIKLSKQNLLLRNERPGNATFMKEAIHPNLPGIGRCHLILASLLALNLLTVTAPAAGPVRERLSFDAGWRFIKADPPGTGFELSYVRIKPWVMATGNRFLKDSQPLSRPAGNPGGNVAYTQPQYNDSDWQQLNLPHDWGIEGPFNQAAPGSTGKLPWEGVGWYRKHFTIPASDQGRRLYLDVDGAMSYANVWVNGQYVGGWPYGYSSWRTGSDAVCQIRRGERGRHSPGQPAGFLALVSGRRHLPQCLAGEDRADTCRALGNLCHHAGGQPCRCHSKNPSGGGQ